MSNPESRGSGTRVTFAEELRAEYCRGVADAAREYQRVTLALEAELKRTTNHLIEISHDKAVKIEALEKELADARYDLDEMRAERNGLKDALAIAEDRLRTVLDDVVCVKEGRDEMPNL